MSSSIRSKLRHNRGMTMVEVLTAFAVATAGIFGAMETHMRVMERVRLMHEEAVAWEAVVNEMEILKAIPLAQLQPGEALPFITSPDLELLISPETLHSVKPRELPGLVELVVQVQWSGENGRRITRTLSTLRAERGAPSNE